MNNSDDQAINPEPGVVLALRSLPPHSPPSPSFSTHEPHGHERRVHRAQRQRSHRHRALRRKQRVRVLSALSQSSTTTPTTTPTTSRWATRSCTHTWAQASSSPSAPAPFSASFTHALIAHSAPRPSPRCSRCYLLIGILYFVFASFLINRSTYLPHIWAPIWMPCYRSLHIFYI